MIFYQRRAAVLVTLAVVATGAFPLGFGVTPGSAVLGLPLDLRIPLRLEPGEDVSADCISAQVQFGDTPLTPGTVIVRLEPATAGASDRVIRIQSTTRVNEPVVTLDLSAGCISRVARTLTLFADPPTVVAPQLADSPAADGTRTAIVVAPLPAASGPSAVLATAGSAPLPIAPTQAAAPVLQESQSRPASEGSREARKAGPAKPAAPAPKESVQSQAVEAPSPARPPAAAAAGLTAPPPRKGAVPEAKPQTPTPSVVIASETPRLKLSTLEDGAGARTLPSQTAAAAASAASAVEAAASALVAASAASAAEAAAIARAAELEATGRKLKDEVERTQRQLNELSAKLREVEANNQGDPLVVYLLGALVILLSGALWFMWRQREQDRQPASWLEVAPVAPDAEEPRSGSLDAVAAPAQAAPTPRTWWDAGSGGNAPPPEASDSRFGSPSGYDSVFAPLGRPRRSVSVEELIDLEQQAEFFIVLGQDEAAVDLLSGHLGNGADASPLPYLKLLEIFKRRGARDEYERLRELFSRQFSANAPDWGTDLQGGRSLADYPDTMDRLQRLWSSPRQAMEILQAVLLRDGADEAGAYADHESFDLPAYRELMLLYSIARDLAEIPVETPAIDFVLPGEPARSPATSSSAFGRLMSTVPVEAQPQAEQTLSIDLLLDDLGAWPSVDPSAAKKPGG